MPPKLNPETPKQQYARFKREAQKLIDAGELSPTAAEAEVDRILRAGAKPPAAP